MSVRPDRRWITKQLLVLLTISATLVAAMAITHLIVDLITDPGDGAGDVIRVLWRVTGWLVLAMWVLTVPAIVLWFRNLDYVIEQDKIVIRKGILTKIQQNIPLRMITDFRLQRTLYDRALGLGSIQIQTAGQGATATGYEGKLAGLGDWAPLHEGLRNRLKTERIADGQDRGGQAELDDIHALLDEVRVIRRTLESSR